MSESKSNVHIGHRARMRQKLIKHGIEIFDTYELLEMLLYHVIPYKDTNPIAKRLLHRFGDLGGVISAKSDELVSVEEVGERTAELIKAVELIDGVLAAESRMPEPSSKLNDYTAVGNRIVNHFYENPEDTVLFLFFDSGMRLVGTRNMSGARFGSAANRPRLIISAVIETEAAVVISAQNNYRSIPLMSESDRESVKMIDAAMRDIGVFYAEHYVVSGRKYTSGLCNVNGRALVRSGEVEAFLESIPYETEGGEDEA